MVTWLEEDMAWLPVEMSQEEDLNIWGTTIFHLRPSPPLFVLHGREKKTYYLGFIFFTTVFMIDAGKQKAFGRVSFSPFYLISASSI